MSNNLQQPEPQAVDFEVRLLGGLLASKRAFDAVDGLISDEDFFKPQHAVVFASIAEMFRNGEVIAKPTVSQKLKDRAAIDGVHAASYVDDIPVRAVSDQALAHLATVIREKSQLRALAQAGRLIESLAYSGEPDPKAAFAEAEAAIRAILDVGTAMVELNMSKVWQDAYNRIGEFAETKTTSDWPTIDNLTGGFLPRTFTVWGGGAGSGKSATVQQLALYASKNLGPVAIFPTELGQPEMASRFLAASSGVSLNNQRRGRVSQRGYEKCADSIAELSDYPIEIFDQKNNSIADIRRSCRWVVKKYGRIGMIIVDHVDFVREVQASKPSEKHSALDKVYQALSAMRHEFNASVHAVQHINRDGMRLLRPTVSDLKGGGNPEGVADSVILIYRPETSNSIDPSMSHEERQAALIEEQSIGEWIVAKSRHGIKAPVPMRFDGARHYWSEDVAA